MRFVIILLHTRLICIVNLLKFSETRKDYMLTVIFPFGCFGGFQETLKPFVSGTVEISRGGLPGPMIFTSVRFSSEPMKERHINNINEK